MKLTEKYLDVIKNKLVTKPLLWIDNDYSVITFPEPCIEYLTP